MTSSYRPSWQLKQIDEAKRVVKQELDDALESGGHKARLECIYARTRELKKAETSESQLYLFIFIVSALVHQSRYGGLPVTQIRNMVNLAYDLLKIQGIKPQTSQLAFLYGELHLALSQIHRKQGRHWTASWEQQLSYHLSRKNPPGGSGFQTLAIAIRALRMGHAARAYQAFLDTENSGVTHDQYEIARIGRIRSLRFQADYEASAALIAETSRRDQISHRLGLELEWESHCLAIAGGEDISALINAVQNKGSHRKTDYLLETFLWANAVRERGWTERLPKMSTITRKKYRGPRTSEFLIRAAVGLEEAYNDDIPFAFRLKALGELLDQSNMFIAIDRELLFYVASARWLARKRCETLAAITLAEYQGMCLKMSHGKSSDILNIARDLLERPWFEECAA